ncbi:siderophore-interacting protein [Cryobacterium sp. PAMC25264]|uniref:siderophore-interacting protein n=1 Tax=Cryobacterium sp. PAMC25264 TaxID=2861288 RepID=UPI001C627A6B|nr:siderophore-interacting protein [Cryobacterium sp. PAMC25264]QYF73932.1 siderophore-interacting protein [Cryobacterium sp. PAMC25264]
MLTSTVAPAPTARVRAPRPSYRPFAVSVARVQRLSTNFTRVTFTGPDLHEFGTAGLDQRIKLVLPLPGVGVSPFPRTDSWYETWRDLPDEHRNPLRTYTVRHARPEHREVDIDFVTHGDAGPASRWVRAAIVGDEVAIVGPVADGDNPIVGIEWAPGNANTVLIAGDETAAPAICAILSALPRTARGCAYIEVPEDGDAHETNAPDGVTVTWLARNGASHGSRLEAAARSWTARFITAHHSDTVLPEIDVDESILWEVPDGSGLDGELYAWLAGEASVIKRLRRFLVTDVGIDRRQVAFMGYWRDGRAEHA